MRKDLLTLWLLRLLSLHSSHVQSKHDHNGQRTKDYATFRRDVFDADKTQREQDQPVKGSNAESGSANKFNICLPIGYNIQTLLQPYPVLLHPFRKRGIIKNRVKSRFDENQKHSAWFELQQIAVTPIRPWHYWVSSHERSYKDS